MASTVLVLTHDTSVQEVEQFVKEGGNVNVRVRNPRWFQTPAGQWLALNLILVVYLTVIWIVSWMFWLGPLTVAAAVGPSLFMAGEVLPKRFLLGYDRLEASWKLALVTFLFLRMPFWMKLTFLILLAVAVTGPSIYHGLQNRRLGEDNSLLHLACFFKVEPTIVKILIDAGSEINARNSELNTPLHFAVGDLELTKVLIDNGAEIDCENHSNDRPIDLVKKAGIARLLLDAGSRGNAKWHPVHEIGSYHNLQIKFNIAKSLRPGQRLCFISHHKNDAAASAVYLHGVLCTRFKLKSDQVFLDSNALEDLRNIIDLVKSSKVLIVIQTRDVLLRPFCLAEMFTAVSSEIPIICVHVEGQGYDFEDAKRLLSAPSFRNELEQRSPGATEILETQGLNVDTMAKILFGVIPNVISKPFNPSASERVRGSQIDDIVQAIYEKL